jgi:site-specific DNA-cytosine methylase
VEELESYGYSSKWAVLNSKSFGVPQNRERVFLVSTLGDEVFNFPQPFPLERRLKDVLESNVDEKYYLSDKLITSLMQDCGGVKGMRPSTPPHDGIASCLLARYHKMGRTDNYIQD